MTKQPPKCKLTGIRLFDINDLLDDDVTNDNKKWLFDYYNKLTYDEKRGCDDYFVMLDSGSKRIYTSPKYPINNNTIIITRHILEKFGYKIMPHMNMDTVGCYVNDDREDYCYEVSILNEKLRIECSIYGASFKLHDIIYFDVTDKEYVNNIDKIELNRYNYDFLVIEIGKDNRYKQK